MAAREQPAWLRELRERAFERFCESRLPDRQGRRLALYQRERDRADAV